MTVPRGIVEDVFRAESGRLLASLIRKLGDFELADEAMQDAFTAALEHWPTRGVPDRPAAWIMTTARNRAIDRLRRRKNAKSVSLDSLADAGRAIAGDLVSPQEAESLDGAIEDDRLRLIFTCCHPALSVEAQVALTLRTLGGLTTLEVARAFLVPLETVAQRISRARQKIQQARIPYEVPAQDAMPGRLEAVLAVIYLVFNEGYSASSGGEVVRAELSAEAIRLGRVLLSLMPGQAEVKGLVALMLLQDSRRPARVSPDGQMIFLEDQDRAKWDHAAIAEGLALLSRGSPTQHPGVYELQARIAAIHAAAASFAETDWPQAVALYEALLRLQPSPVVALNRAVAVAYARGWRDGLDCVDDVAASGELDHYPYLHAARGELLRRLGRFAEARAAFVRAYELGGNDAGRAVLKRQIDECAAAAWDDRRAGRPER